MPRDWSKIASLPLADLPKLTAGDDAFIDDFLEETRRQQWGEHPRATCVHSLRVLAAWLGTDAEIPEADIQTLAAVVSPKPGPRLAQFLAYRAKLVPTPREDPDLLRIEALISQNTGQVADELRVWVQVLRGGGRWEHPATPWTTIRRYLTYLRPVLAGWQEAGITTLREVSRDAMRTALRARQGRAAEAVHVAARSLFRALKQERVVFADPTRGLTVAAVAKIPRSIPPDYLKGIIDRAPGPAGKLVVALVAIHALGPTEVARLLSSDVDLSRGQLLVRRPGRRHLVYLDNVTYELTADWLQERHRLWPFSSNPHLIVSQMSAMDSEGPTVSRGTIKNIFTRLGVSAQRIRIDRIFHEAQLTADPLHLMRLFGISDGTAVRYVQTAHPERTGKSLR